MITAPDPGPDEIYRIGSTICIRIDDDNHLNNRPLARVELKCPNVEAIPDENIPPDIPTPTRTWTHTSLDGTATAVMASDKVRREPEVTDEFIVAFPLLQPVNAMNIFVIVTRGDQDTLFFETFNVTRNLTERYDVLRQSFGFWTCKLNNSLGSVAATTFISDYCKSDCVHKSVLFVLHNSTFMHSDVDECALYKPPTHTHTHTHVYSGLLSTGSGNSMLFYVF